MNYKRVQEIVEYMKKNPVRGFDLVIAKEHNNAESNPPDNSPCAMLIYQVAGFEGKDIVIFIGENDGVINYYTVFPVLRETKRGFIECAYSLIGEMLAVPDEHCRIHVTEHSVVGRNGYIVDFDSINRERLNSNEHIIISTILWGTLAIHCLGQEC